MSKKRPPDAAVQAGLFPSSGNEALREVDPQYRDPNPCVRAFGVGPAGKKCGDCNRLAVRVFAKNYYKCTLRQVTAGPGTDHRVGWKACAKYAEGPIVCSVCGTEKDDTHVVKYADNGQAYCESCYKGMVMR
jgi:hypothetical protein